MPGADQLKGFHTTGEYRTNNPASYGDRPHPELRAPRKDALGGREAEDKSIRYAGPSRDRHKTIAPSGRTREAEEAERSKPSAF
jgi:hypothetical protein